MDIRFITTFHTHFGAQSFSRKLKKVQIAYQMMPVPRQLSASCGICVAFENDLTEQIRADIPEDMEGLYEVNGKSFTTVLEIDE